jgi:hypothetical protein
MASGGNESGGTWLNGRFPRSAYPRLSAPLFGFDFFSRALFVFGHGFASCARRLFGALLSFEHQPVFVLGLC